MNVPTASVKHSCDAYGDYAEERTGETVTKMKGGGGDSRDSGDGEISEGNGGGGGVWWGVVGVVDSIFGLVISRTHLEQAHDLTVTLYRELSITTGYDGVWRCGDEHFRISKFNDQRSRFYLLFLTS